MGKVESVLRRMVFGVAMVLGGMAWSYDATYTAGETVTISGAGSYLVTGSGAGGVTVAANVTGVTVTYSNVTSTATALKLNSGSAVKLVLLGVSTVECGENLGILLPETATLTVEGPGSMRVHALCNAPIGVGGGMRMGTLVVNSGRIEASCGAAKEQGLSAAIGGSYVMGGQAGHGGTVVVNGGELIATSYSGGPAIGGGGTYYYKNSGTCGDGGSLTVNGGKVVARSYSTQGNYCNGQRAAAVGGGAARNAGGKNGRAAKIVVTGGELEGWVDHADATCFGNATGAGTAQTNASDAGLTVTGGTVRWNHLRSTSETGFAFSFSNCAVGYSASASACYVGMWLPLTTDLTSFFGNGVVFEKAKDQTVPIQTGTIALADLAKGNVTLSESGPFMVVGCSASTANKVVATAGTTVEAAIYEVRSTGAWEVPANAKVTLWVYATNTLEVNGVCYKLPATGTLALKGTGAWTLVSANSSLQSAIGVVGNTGNWGTLEVDGPTIEAIGSDRASGVGGSYSYQGTGASGGAVIVRSGTLIARGYGAAPGIGGGAPYNGTCGSGPSVTVYTNGTLYAYNMAGNRGGPNRMESFGVAIGAGRPPMAGNTASNAGTIVVDGGTLYASVGNAGVSCFGCAGTNSGLGFTQKAGATGALTVKNGGRLFFNHATFPSAMTVTVDDGTLGTLADTPPSAWVTFLAGQATVANRLGLAGAVEPILTTLPTFLNNPEVFCETSARFAAVMGENEWVVPAGPAELKADNGYCLKEQEVESERWVRSEIDEGWVHLNRENSTYTVTSNGVYRFTGKGATGATAIKVNPGVVCTNIFYKVDLTVTSGGMAPLELNAGSQVTLQLMDNNSLKRNQTSMQAVIRVPDTAALVIEDAGNVDQPGALTIDMTGASYDHLVGIGNAGANCKSGAVTVNSGKVTISMAHANNRHGGAAIGTAGGASTFGSYTQNGGVVTLDGPGLAPAIGGGTDNGTCGSGGSVLITGGTLTAKGYSGASAIGLAPTYASGKVGKSGSYRQTGGTVYAYAYAQGSYSAGQCGAAIGGSGTRNGTTASTMGTIEISGGALYAYSEKSYSFGCGKPQNGAVPALAATDSLVITGGAVWAPQGAQASAAVNADGVKVSPYGVPLATLTGATTTLDLGEGKTYVFPNVNLGNNYVYPWLPSMALTIGGRDYVYGVDHSVTHKFDGQRLTYVVGEAVLTTGNALVSGKGAIAFEGTCSATLSNFLFKATVQSGFAGPLALGGTSQTELKLVGTNTVQTFGDTAVIALPTQAALTISGGEDDWLKIDESSSTIGNQVGIGVGGNNTTSMGKLTLNSGNVDIRMATSTAGFGGAAVGVAAGNRNAGTVIVNGGYLYAAGAAIAAGIGGGYNNGGQAGHGGRVEVNGDKVIAKGYGGSAGIGGGTCYNGAAGNGGTFIQRGGEVFAYAYNTGMHASGNVGAAIGGAARRDATGRTGAAGTIIVSNGTLNVFADLNGAAVGFGNPKGGIKAYDGTAANFTIAGGSVKMASSNIAPSNGVAAVSCATISRRYLGAAPYSVMVTSRTNPGWSYPYDGSGHPDDDNLYFYLTEGRYQLGSKSFVFENGVVTFPGMVIYFR